MKILAIFAHPDDESFGPAGTLTLASQNGHIVSLLTLTHGESGTLGISKYLSSAELAKRRSEELRNAAKKLGIQHYHIHNFPDKNLAQTQAIKGIEFINAKIKYFRPDIIITYHENTISGHPDHRVVTDWTYNAIKSIKNPPKLFYFGLDQEQTTMVPFAKLIPITDSEITHTINVEKFINYKIAAIQCHKTQEAIWQQLMENRIDFKEFAKWEFFVQKIPKPNNHKVKHNIFE